MDIFISPPGMGSSGFEPRANYPSKGIKFGPGVYPAESVLFYSGLSRQELNYLIQRGIGQPSVFRGKGRGSRHLFSRFDMAEFAFLGFCLHTVGSTPGRLLSLLWTFRLFVAGALPIPRVLNFRFPRFPENLYTGECVELALALPLAVSLKDVDKTPVGSYLSHVEKSSGDYSNVIGKHILLSYDVRKPSVASQLMALDRRDEARMENPLSNGGTRRKFTIDARELLLAPPHSRYGWITFYLRDFLKSTIGEKRMPKSITPFPLSLVAADWMSPNADRDAFSIWAHEIKTYTEEKPHGKKQPKTKRN